jgi:hypothetical protein
MKGGMPTVNILLEYYSRSGTSLVEVLALTKVGA